MGPYKMGRAQQRLAFSFLSKFVFFNWWFFYMHFLKKKINTHSLVYFVYITYFK